MRKNLRNKEIEKEAERAMAHVKKFIKYNLSGEGEKVFFNKLLMDLNSQWKQMKVQHRKMLDAKDHGKQWHEAYSKWCVAFDKHERINERLKDIQRQMDIRMKKTSGDLDAIEMSALEKEVVKNNPEIFSIVIGLQDGIAKQLVDVYTGQFDLVIRAEKGDNDAQKKIFNLLEKFVKSSKAWYQKWGISLSDGEIYQAMLEAIKNWEKNKKLSHFQWIRGRIRRELAEKRKKVFQKNERNDRNADLLFQEEGEIAIDSTLQGNEDGAIFSFAVQDNKRKRQLPKLEKINQSKEIWIDEAAERVGVTSETLRNWDRKGIFKATKKEHNGKKYRVYKTYDIDSLKEIEKEQKRKRGHCKEGYFKLNDLIKHLGISRSTMLRYEKLGKIPSPRRDKNGVRLYSVSEARKLKEIIKK